jgi:hypothetical protein
MVMKGIHSEFFLGVAELLFIAYGLCLTKFGGATRRGNSKVTRHKILKRIVIANHATMYSMLY